MGCLDESNIEGISVVRDHRAVCQELFLEQAEKRRLVEVFCQKCCGCRKIMWIQGEPGQADKMHHIWISDELKCWCSVRKQGEK